MILRPRALACVVALASHAFPVHAQPRDADGSWTRLESPFSLDESANKLLERNRELNAMRGVARASESARVSPTELQRALQPGEALLLYDSRPDRLVLHALVADAPVLTLQVPVAATELRSAIRSWREALVPGDVMATRAPALRSATRAGVPSAAPRPSEPSAARVVSEWLLPEALQVALDRWSVRHLSIAGGADVAVLPWAALRMGSGVLLDRYSVSIVPELADYLRTTQGGAGAGLQRIPEFRFQVQRSVLVGNPKYPALGEWTYPDLPGAEAEARVVADVFRSTARVGPAATKVNMQRDIREQSPGDVLYLATHAVASSTQPLDESFIVLAGERDDAKSRWTAREIQSGRLAFSLAVLSACQTGLGQAHDAGVIGVARAFYLAGVPQTVMSLWSVDDRSTQALMSRFARELSRERPFRFFPAEALRDAMLATRQLHPEPARWASFVVFGIPNVVWP